MGPATKTRTARKLEPRTPARAASARRRTRRRPLIAIVKVLEVEPLGGFRLRLLFSDGAEGERDFSDIIAEGGPMVEPLQDPAFFARVFIELGTLIWPNHFDLDSIALHDEMKAAGLLRRSAA